MTDKRKFLATLNTLAAMFGRPLSDPIADAWWDALSDLTDEQVSTAARAALKTCKFMPTPAEIRDLAGKGPAVSAAVAWEAVLGAIHQHDYTTSVDFGIVANAVVRNMGGWLKLCDMKKSETPFERKRFEALFTEFSLRPISELGGGHLDGEYGGKPVRVGIPGAVYSDSRALPSAEDSVKRIMGAP